jgi:hypothetical protein
MKKCFLFHKWRYIIKEASLSYDSVERICKVCNKHQVKVDIGCADFRWLNTNKIENVEKR